MFRKRRSRTKDGKTYIYHFICEGLRVFQAHGLPVALYVDYHSFFYTHDPDAFTQLGTALYFYGVQLRYAPTPQAKGKIERRHDYWQKRLVPLLAADQIVELVGAIHGRQWPDADAWKSSRAGHSVSIRT